MLANQRAMVHKFLHLLEMNKVTEHANYMKVLHEIGTSFVDNGFRLVNVPLAVACCFLAYRTQLLFLKTLQNKNQQARVTTKAFICTKQKS